MIDVAPRPLSFSGAPSMPGMPPMASTSAGSNPSRNDSASCCPLSRLRIETVSDTARRNPTMRSSPPNSASRSSATCCGTTASASETLRPGVVSYCTRWSTRPEISIAWLRRLLLSVSPVVNADEMISVLSISPKTIQQRLRPAARDVAQAQPEKQRMPQRQIAHDQRDYAQQDDDNHHQRVHAEAEDLVHR